MPHGTPDFWGTTPKTTTYNLGDMAELAVRLGSYVNYDRRGEVIWLTGFDQGGLDWYWAGSGVGADVYLNAFSANHNGVCIILKTGAAAGSMSQLNKVMRWPVLSNVGLEISFALDNKTALVMIGLSFYDGTNKTMYWLGYDHATGKVNAYDHLGTATLIGTPGVLRDVQNAFVQFKVVIDSLAGTFIRAMINEHTYDASAITPDVVASGTAKSLALFVEVSCAAAGAASVSLDDVILTQNEPS